jgi:hypothetical protein
MRESDIVYFRFITITEAVSPNLSFTLSGRVSSLMRTGIRCASLIH